MYFVTATAAAHCSTVQVSWCGVLIMSEVASILLILSVIVTGDVQCSKSLCIMSAVSPTERRMTERRTAEHRMIDYRMAQCIMTVILND